jgi:hypothetical protein
MDRKTQAKQCFGVAAVATPQVENFAGDRNGCKRAQEMIGGRTGVDISHADAWIRSKTSVPLAAEGPKRPKKTQLEAIARDGRDKIASP